jgi:16S rRNA processing protein RimM
MTDTFSYPADRYLLIGKVGKPHGLHGEVRMHLYSRQPDNVRSYGQVVLISTVGRLSSSIRVITCRVQKKTAVVGLESIVDRTGAEQLAGMGVLVDKKDISQADDGELYWYQFDGLPVTTLEGRSLGKVKKIFSNGAQDILVVGKGNDEYLIPILDEIIVRRTDEGIVVAPPPGLLEINSGIADGGDD